MTEEVTQAVPLSAPANALLLLLVGPAGSTTAMLPARGEITIGRAADCDVRVDDTELSRKHGAIRVTAEDVVYVDLHSLNGSFVRDERLVPGVTVRLAPGDSVILGDTVLVLLRAASVGARPRHLRAHRHFQAVLEEARGQRDQSASESGTDTVVGAGALDLVVDRIANSLVSVLILGETGVGKDVLARRIHARSPRAGRPLVSINCAALSESLLESELFGHEKGAFTGALSRKLGLVESANGGTVFLDEIGEMPLATQAKILRLLEQREVTRVGAVRPRPIDVRFISATNHDVKADVAAGRLRADLYFRINGITLSLPPLRDRLDEIEPLANSFIEDACRTMEGRRVARLSPESLAILRQYQWPGNIRELRNIMERAVVLCGADLITPSHLLIARAAPSDACAPSTIPPPSDPGRDDERARVVHALEQCVWNQAHAAKLLGISRGTLIKRIVAFGLPRPRKSA